MSGCIGRSGPRPAKKATAKKPADKKPAKPKAKKPSKTALDDSWRKYRLGAAGFNDQQIDALETAGIHTLGDVQDAMKVGIQWHKKAGVNGRYRQSIEDVLAAYLTEVFSKAE
ncbi:hypothetical protein M0R72_12745 [Candidatus Pacearchaeota archaeon]|jgi:hypothetical protein|nr:hypothetical protein [Candidatus Pacearchaeota archaeon]